MTGLVLVSGLCRCGSSLMMQMLTAGGWPAVEPEVAGWPAFEHPANMGRAALPPNASGVMKWLDPQRFTPPFDHVRGSIFLTRDHRNQARSHVKFLRACGIVNGPVAWRPLAASFGHDERLALKVLRGLGPVMTVRFEDLVTSPLAVLGEVYSFIGERLDVAAAARQLRPRKEGAAVLPYMLEMILLQQGGPS